MNIPTPRLFESTLDDEMLDQVFHDIGALGASIEVRTRPSANGPTSLSDAHRMLETGIVRGVQIRYGYDDRRWCDTFTRLPDTIRLCRMECEPLQENHDDSTHA